MKYALLILSFFCLSVSPQKDLFGGLILNKFEPGQLVYGIVTHPAEIIYGDFSIGQGKNQIGSGPCYPIPNEKNAFLGYFPLHSFTKPGIYWAKFTVSFKNGLKQSISYEFEVINKIFTEEIIPMNKEGQDIKTKPDPIKDEQIAKMAKVLKNIQKDAPIFTELFQKPLENLRQTSGYGDRRTYTYPNGSKSTDDHRGLDYGAPIGTPVKASARGKVVLAENRITTGNTLILEIAPGAYILYFHMNKLSPKLGDIVDAGSLVGEVGKTGFATGPHLHYEIQVYGWSINPEYFYTIPMIDTGAIHKLLSSLILN